MENKFEEFIDANFSKIPAVVASKTTKEMSKIYRSALKQSSDCDVEGVVKNWASFCALSRQIQDETVTHYNNGLITNVEMMNIITKFPDFLSNEAPREIVGTLFAKCTCRQN